MSKARRTTTGREAIISRTDVARLLCVSPSTITRWSRDGRLPCIRTLGGHRRYLRDRVMEIAASILGGRAPRV